MYISVAPSLSVTQTHYVPYDTLFVPSNVFRGENLNQCTCTTVPTPRLRKATLNISDEIHASQSLRPQHVARVYFASA